MLTCSADVDRAQMYQHFIDQFEPNGVVDLAFKTDEINPVLTEAK